CLDWQISRPGSLEDLVHVARRALLHLGDIDAIGHEPTCLDEYPKLVDGGDPMRARKIEDGLSMYEHERRRHQSDSLVVILLHAEEGNRQILCPTHGERVNLDAKIPGGDRDPFVEPRAYLGQDRGRDILSKERDPRKMRNEHLEELQTLRNEIIV